VNRSSATPESARLLLVRHGESAWNHEQRFTGWADIGLTHRGEQQMREAGIALSQAAVRIDVVFASLLCRCTESAIALLKAADSLEAGRSFDWRLNERHYGALTGRSKLQAITEFGAEAVHHWRRSYRAVPPPWNHDDAQRHACDPRYAGLGNLPLSESLEQTVARVRELWRDSIEPKLLPGRTAAVIGHGNSLRALAMLLEGLSEEQVSRLEIANGEMRFYALDTSRSASLHQVWRPTTHGPLSTIL
jgi:2,3-bisphosphoglycerate-dependent phosphoglycerate mutase